jgi:hypothetical protein
MNRKNFMIVLILIMTVLSVNCTQLEYMKAVISAIEQKDYATDDGFKMIVNLIKSDNSSCFDVERLLLVEIDHSKDINKYDKEIEICKLLENKYKDDVNRLFEIRSTKLNLLNWVKNYDELKKECYNYYSHITDIEYKSFILYLVYLNTIKDSSLIVEDFTTKSDQNVYEKILKDIVKTDILKYTILKNTYLMYKIYINSSKELLDYTDFDKVKSLRFEFIAWSELENNYKSSQIIWRSPFQEQQLSNFISYLQRKRIDKNRTETELEAINTVLNIVVKEKNNIK